MSTSMFTKLKDKATLALGGSILRRYEAEELNAGKRLISVIAGAYILQRGIKALKTRPVIAAEEIILGGMLLFSAASGLNKKITRRPVEPSDFRRNQIQGNDPASGVPAFV
ncbi:hypothetical protein [Pedobacter deserti]|uniref:hypothetical protein n=1 Tax=Pedobacter deserti TaxID=2817382 RepID=UPI00210C359C|nr:hypothetical protein [Pedobacter sp. SYSU D00382]